MDLSLVVDALCCVESGAPVAPLPRAVAVDFLDEAIHFRRSVAYASLRLTAELTRHEAYEVRARAVAALSGWADHYGPQVEALLLERVGDPVAAVRNAVIGTLAVLLAHTVERDLLTARFRKHSRQAHAAIREARRLQPG